MYHQIKHLRYFLCLCSLVLFSLFTDFSYAQKTITQANSAPSKPDLVTKKYKLAPFSTLYLKGGPLRIKLVNQAIEPMLEIKGEAEAVKQTKIWMQTASKILHLTVPDSHNSTHISITLQTPQLKEIHHQSSQPVLIHHLREPISIIASGLGALSLEDIYSSFLHIRGSEKSQIRLSGRIETLEATLQDRATLDTTCGYIQRSFIKTQDHAFAITGVNARLLAANALDHSLIRYTYDAPVQGLFTQYKAWIVRSLPN